MEEYRRHKDYIEEIHKRKTDALKRLYPEEWKKDHEKKVKK